MAADRAPITPSTQPLAVFRAARAADVETLFQTRQARALGIDGRDFSGSVPGVEAKFASLKTFIAGLARNDADNVWYCLAQDGGSIARQTGAMGWDARLPDGGADRAMAILTEMGLDARGLDMEVLDIGDGRGRFTICKNTDARRDILGASGEPDEGWRGGLSRFLADGSDGIGLWVNTRPLMGVLSLFAGIDVRAELKARGLGAPVWAQIHLFDTGGDLGFELGFDNILPGGLSGETEPVIVATGRDPLVEVAVPAAKTLWKFLDVDTFLFRVANLDIERLIPSSLTVSLWRDTSGRPAWSAIGLMDDGEASELQFRRVRSWLEAFAAGSPAAVALELVEAPGNGEALRIRIGNASCIAGVAKTGAVENGGALFVAASDADAWPNPDEVRVTRGGAPCVAVWKANLDAESRREMATALVSVAQSKGAAKQFDAAFFDRLLPDIDSGSVGSDAEAATFRSTHSLLPFMLPVIMQRFAVDETRWERDMRMTAARLRFLLEAAHRFRIDGDGRELPQSLSDLATEEAGEWLDRMYAEFPEFSGSVSRILVHLSSGKPLEGMRYRIAGGDDWRLLAEGDDGLLLRLDAGGELSVEKDGIRMEYAEPMFPLPALLAR